MEKLTKAHLEKENKELKGKLRIKSGGCRACNCSKYRDNPRHDKWGRECTCDAQFIDGIDCHCYGLINSFHDIFLKDKACHCGHKPDEHGEK